MVKSVRLKIISNIDEPKDNSKVYSEFFIDKKKWKNFEIILENYGILVYPRPGIEITDFENHTNIKIVKAPLMEISSTFIRQALKSKHDIRHFLPYKVYDYIIEMHYYEHL